LLAGFAWWLSAVGWKSELPIASVVLTIDQVDAEVKIDGQKKMVVAYPGEQPAIRVELKAATGDEASQHLLQVSLRGCEPFVMSFGLVPQERRHITVSQLRPLGPEIREVIPASGPQPAAQSAVSLAVTQREREFATWVIGLGGWVSVM